MEIVRTPAGHLDLSGIRRGTSRKYGSSGIVMVFPRSPRLILEREGNALATGLLPNSVARADTGRDHGSVVSQKVPKIRDYLTPDIMERDVR